MANDYIKKINDYLDKQSFNGFSIFTGSSGQLINLAEQGLDSISNQGKIEELFYSTIKQFNEQNSQSTYTFCDGYSGLGWILEYLSQKELLDCNLNHTLSDFDTVLYNISLEELNKGNYDFLHGAIGIGWYFLERNSSTTTNSKLSNIVSYLHKNSIYAKGQRYWENKRRNDSSVNFGLAHGMPSIIIFLSNCYKQGIEKEKSYSMIIEAFQFMKNFKLKNQLSLYPINSLSQQPSRLAWCYGDLGIAMSFWIAGKNLGVDSLKEEAYQIFKFSSERKSMEKNNIIDAGVCHGTSGVALLFYRFYIETGDSLFYETSLFWIEKTKDFEKRGKGVDGFKSYAGHNDWSLEIGLLEGLIGIALVGDTILNKKDSKWDRCLLLS
ncbi:MAG: lanthionine synthetase C family protein [Bacteroidetes bacterium]|nr:lanthionine synthetase C family protein [Bacteroidota bacterium]